MIFAFSEQIFFIRGDIIGRQYFHSAVSLRPGRSIEGRYLLTRQTTLRRQTIVDLASITPKRRLASTSSSVYAFSCMRPIWYSDVLRRVSYGCFLDRWAIPWLVLRNIRRRSLFSIIAQAFSRGIPPPFARRVFLPGKMGRPILPPNLSVSSGSEGLEFGWRRLARKFVANHSSSTNGNRD